MQIQYKTLTFTVSSICSNPKLPLLSSVTLRAHKPSLKSSLSLVKSHMFIRNCSSPNQELVVDEFNGNGSMTELVQEEVKVDDLADQSIWGQMKEIVMFTGPAAGLWLCGPLMSLIDTAVIGQGSSLELAALGPATVVCDYLSYTFMFLSVATSNLVAISLARQDKDEVQHQISILLFIGLACGVVMMAFTRLFGSGVLTAFTGAKNAEIVPAANTYVQESDKLTQEKLDLMDMGTNPYASADDRSTAIAKYISIREIGESSGTSSIDLNPQQQLSADATYQVETLVTEQQTGIHINTIQEGGSSQSGEQGTKRKEPEEGDREGSAAAKRLESEQVRLNFQQGTVALRREEPPKAP